MKKERFLEDVAHHAMSIRHADGLYRHLLFQANRNNIYWFEIVTWPGALTIRGDMGTWTFSRLEDMFKFFRSSDGSLQINPSYWAEKLCGGEGYGCDSAREWRQERFRNELLNQLTDYYCLEGDDLEIVTAAVLECLNREDGNGREVTYRSISDLMIVLSPGSTFSFEPSELPSGMDYTERFLWCLYAIVWAIQQWDKSRSEVFNG